MALLVVLVWPVERASAQAVTVDTVGGALRVRAPGFDFLQGDPLTRLRDGRTVRVELAVLVLPGPGKPPAAATRQAFALSYDLWEERFAVTALDARAQSVSHLGLAAAEAWCVEQLVVPLSTIGALGGDVPFWIRLEYNVLDGDGGPGSPDGGYTLEGLIDLLSRRRKTDSSSHALEAGPFRTPGRGPSVKR